MTITVHGWEVFLALIPVAIGLLFVEDKSGGPFAGIGPSGAQLFGVVLLLVEIGYWLGRFL